jgi:hypothetical protein
LYGTWEKSYAYLYNFKAKVKELKMPGSVVEIDITKDGDDVYFRRFFVASNLA